MEFLGIGYQEILLVFLLMLVFVGPERMPRVAYQIGRAVREMQKYARAVRDEFSEEIEYLETQYREVEAEVKDAQASLRNETARFDREMRAVTNSIDTAVKDATKDLNAPPSTGNANVVPLSAPWAADTAAPAVNGATVPDAEPGTASATATPEAATPPSPESAEPARKLVF